MPRHSKRLTESEAKKLPLPSEGYQLYTCPNEPGFGVRVSSFGDRAWFFERRVDGKTTRRTLGKVMGPGAISRDAALKLKVDISSELQHGQDRVEARREEAKQVKADALTFKMALEEYVDRKRRSKDGKHLKDRTQADYLRMVRPGRTTKVKQKGGAYGTTQDGVLLPIANKPVQRITAEDIRALHTAAEKRGPRQAAYAMQVLRAVLNWQGVHIEGNPLSKEVAGRERIHIPQARATGMPIPPERIGAWWKAVQAASSEVARDYIMFTALTGCRPSEPLKVLVSDCDLVGGRVLIRDTKARNDHTILLSRQAVEIVQRQANGKKGSDQLFKLVDPKKTVYAITEACGVGFRVKDLRSTFASVAESLVSAYVLKRMMNHTMAGDITGMHYVRLGEAPLRTGWQSVADYFDQQAAIEPELAVNVLEFKVPGAIAA